MIGLSRRAVVGVALLASLAACTGGPAAPQASDRAPTSCAVDPELVRELVGFGDATWTTEEVTRGREPGSGARDVSCILRHDGRDMISVTAEAFGPDLRRTDVLSAAPDEEKRNRARCLDVLVERGDPYVSACLSPPGNEVFVTGVFGRRLVGLQIAGGAAPATPELGRRMAVSVDAALDAAG